MLACRDIDWRTLRIRHTRLWLSWRLNDGSFCLELQYRTTSWNTTASFTLLTATFLVRQSLTSVISSLILGQTLLWHFSTYIRPLHHKVQKFSSGTDSPRWSRKKGHKTVVVWWCLNTSALARDDTSLWKQLFDDCHQEGHTWAGNILFQQSERIFLKTFGGLWHLAYRVQGK